MRPFLNDRLPSWSDRGEVPAGVLWAAPGAVASVHLPCNRIAVKNTNNIARAIVWWRELRREAYHLSINESRGCSLTSLLGIWRTVLASWLKSTPFHFTLLQSCFIDMILRGKLVVPWASASRVHPAGENLRLPTSTSTEAACAQLMSILLPNRTVQQTKKVMAPESILLRRTCDCAYPTDGTKYLYFSPTGLKLSTPLDPALSVISVIIFTRTAGRIRPVKAKWSSPYSF